MIISSSFYFHMYVFLLYILFTSSYKNWNINNKEITLLLFLDTYVHELTVAEIEMTINETISDPTTVICKHDHGNSLITHRTYFVIKIRTFLLTIKILPSLPPAVSFIALNPTLKKCIKWMNRKILCRFWWKYQYTIVDECNLHKKREQGEMQLYLLL